MSFKRKVEGGGGESPAKMAAAGEGAQQPIPIEIHSDGITIPFTQKSWEEIAPGQLYYLPLSQTPAYMIDSAHANLFNKYKELWGTMTISQPKVRITNLVMLQDDLRVQGSTPQDATAFTQVIYLMEYTPQGQSQYFKLGCLPNKDDQLTVQDLTYDLKPPNPGDKQLITLKNFIDFEALTIQGAKANSTAGFIPGQAVQVNSDTGRIYDPYIAPNTVTTQLRMAAGNMMPRDDYTNYIAPTYSLLMAKNQNKLTFYKYGDEIDFTINTNLDGLYLANHPINDFTKLYQIEADNPAGEKFIYDTEFCWPSRNRPYLSRHNYYDINTAPITEGKQVGHLTHHFFCMPPIRKPNGALLGQRCSFIMEQFFSVRLYFNKGTFFPTEQEDAFQMMQNNQILLRRNIYPIPVKVKDETDTNSVFCPRGTSVCVGAPLPPRRRKLIPLPKIPRAKEKKCYENNFKGLIKFLDDTLDLEFNQCFTFLKDGEPPTNSTDVLDISDPLAPNEILEYPGFMKIWESLIDEEETYFYPFRWIGPPEEEDGYYVYWKDSKGRAIVKQGTDIDFPTLIYMDKRKFLKLFFESSTTVCKPTTYAVADKTAKCFFV
nr:MAG: major capsid protein [Army ant associated bidensovirus 4]